MGREASCKVEYEGETYEGKALLETDFVLFRGGVRLKILFNQISNVEADDGRLRLGWKDKEAGFLLGRDAPLWAKRILTPPTLADKLGVKPGMFVCLIGQFDKEFKALLVARGASLLDMRDVHNSDMVFVKAETPDELNRLGPFTQTLKDTGAIWVVTPRGVPALKDVEVIARGRDAGLVDVKTCRFSDTHTALKFMVPKVRRKAT